MLYAERIQLNPLINSHILGKAQNEVFSVRALTTSRSKNFIFNQRIQSTVKRLNAPNSLRILQNRAVRGEFAHVCGVENRFFCPLLLISI